MSFLLDTDICSAHLKADRRVWQKLLQHSGQLHVSAISAGELFTWAVRRGTSSKRRHALLTFLRDVTVLDITPAVSEKFGELRAGLLDVGRPAPDMDLFIGATAILHDLTLVTHNVEDFADIPGLRIQDWLTES